MPVGRRRSALSIVGAALALFIFAAWWRKNTLAAELKRGAALYASIQPHAGSIPILIPVYSRPHYLRRVIHALRNVLHINRTVLVFSQDGDSLEIAEQIAGIDFAPVVHLRHSQPYFNVPSALLRTDAPTASNVFFLLSFAFDVLPCTAAIVLESDLLPSTDFYDYFEFALTSVASSPLRDSVFTVNGFYFGSRPENDLYTVSTDDAGFMVWGWGCPRQSWPAIRAGWTWFANWDITLEESVRRPSGKVSLSPLVSRVRNIGFSGINFNVQDAHEQAAWEGLYTPTTRVDYTNKTLKVVKHTRT